MKYLSLLLLTCQNAATILLLRYVRTTPGPRFVNSSAVFISEVQKLMFSIVLLTLESGRLKQSLQSIYVKFFKETKDTLKIGIPAVLYVIQNNLLYLSISNLDAATFQISSQLKILTTALFMVVIFQRQLSLSQWFSLFLLFIGVSLVQIDNLTASKPKPNTNVFVGFLAVASACTISGLAGVYFEKILKGDDKASIWMKNIQMSFYGSIFAYLTVLSADREHVKQHGFFFGYTNLVWIAILTQSAGGLLVAVVLKYADNILKGFATSLAIIVSCLLSIVIFDFKLTALFSLGSVLVILSILIYSNVDFSCRMFSFVKKI